MQSDQRLAHKLGSAYTVEPDSFDGNIQIWDAREVRLGERKRPGGKAEFTLVLNGANGRATVHYSGQLKDGVWKASQLDLTRLTKGKDQ
jgi:hypothetical protein